jgi:hypothetical protein
MQVTIPPRPGSVPPPLWRRRSRWRRQCPFAPGVGPARRSRRAAHADSAAALLKFLYQAELLFRKDAGIDGEIVRAGSVGDLPRGQTGPPSPTARATVAAVAAASPVTMTLVTPSDQSSLPAASTRTMRWLSQARNSGWSPPRGLIHRKIHPTPLSWIKVAPA